MADILLIRAVRAYFDHNIKQPKRDGYWRSETNRSVERTCSIDIHSRRGRLFDRTSRGAFPIRFHGRVHGAGVVPPLHYLLVFEYMSLRHVCVQATTN
jgi:hypothetical protein